MPGSNASGGTDDVRSLTRIDCQWNAQDLPYVEPTNYDTPDSIYQHIHYTNASADSSAYASPNAYDADGSPCVEIYFHRDMVKVVQDDSALQPDELLVMQVLLKQDCKKAVIERVTDLLTSAELLEYPKEVAAAVLE